MDSRIKAKVVELVGAGVRRLPEIRRHLEHFVRGNLFTNQPAPDLTDARFWPSSKTLLNCVYRTRVQLR